MRRPWFWIGLLLAGGSLWAKSPVSVEGKSVATVYHHDRSTEQIEAMSTIKAPSRAAHEPGLTIFEYEVSSRYQLALSAKRPEGPFKVWVKTLEAQFDIDKMEVYVSSKYPEGSCQYRAVMDHENTHVRINRRTWAEYLKVLKRDLGKVPLPTKAHPWTVKVQSQAQERLDALIKPVLKRVEDRFVAENRRENAKIDTPASYRRTSAKCRDW